MTALEKYVRLEALGIWRESAIATPREVVVSFGDATLVLTDLSDRPLGHWALAGARPLTVADGATVYSMTPEGEETLAIRDVEMIDAIAAVSRDYRRAMPTPPPPRRRIPLTPLLVMGLCTAAAVYGPGLLRDQAVRMVPTEQAWEFGDRMLLAILSEHGPLCADPAGSRALSILGAQIADGVPTRVLNMGGTVPVVTLPGPVVLLDAQTLGRATSPDELAGWIIASLGLDPSRSPLTRLMEATGPLSNLRYILTGQVSEAELAKAAEKALSPAAMGEDFLPALGYSAPLMTDQQWMALRGICG